VIKDKKKTQTDVLPQAPSEAESKPVSKTRFGGDFRHGRALAVDWIDLFASCVKKMKSITKQNWLAKPAAYYI